MASFPVRRPNCWFTDIVNNGAAKFIPALLCPAEHKVSPEEFNQAFY